MGMFDYLRCEYPLPDGFTGQLQTKDLDCEMVEHTITKEGRLLEEYIISSEIVPKAERPYPDAADDDFRSLYGSIRTTRAKRDANFHGILNFYALERKPGMPDKWHEYDAKFTDGQIVEIKVIVDA